MATIYSSLTTITVTSSGSTGTDPAADWKARISDPGVVWYHNFDTASEVNKFRWVSGYGSGNNPSGSQYPSEMYHVPTGGADGGGYMEIFRPAGTQDPHCNWCRMFNPLTGASNGRGSDDPGANGSLLPQVFTPTEGGGQFQEWGTNVRAGWYGLPEYQAAGDYGNPTYPQPYKVFDGLDFYLQIRVKMDPRRMSAGSSTNGKFIVLTNTRSVTYSAQEIVTVSAYPTTSGVGAPNVHQMYDGSYGYFNSSISDDFYVNKIWNPVSPKWTYSGGWDTLLYHITPGHRNTQDPQTWKRDTKVEVWAAHPGQTSYTKIWDNYHRAYFAQNEQYARDFKWGWNSIWLTAFMGGTGNEFVTSNFTHSFDQIIFSKNFIPCPQYP